VSSVYRSKWMYVTAEFILDLQEKPAICDE
jgi:hypothetical protein